MGRKDPIRRTAGRPRPGKVAITPGSFDAVAFDLDGVITRTALVHEAAWRQVFDEFLERRAKIDNRPFVPFAPDDYRKHVDGRPRDEGIRTFLASRGITLPEGEPDDGADRETVHGLGRRKNDLFLENLARFGVEVDPHTVPLLERLHAQGFKTAVVSSSKNCAAVLRAAGIDALFDARVDGLDREALGLEGKPAPDTFLEAARRLGASPARTVVVEDALVGVAAGRAGRFGLVIGVGGEDAADALREHGADVVVPDLSMIEIGATPAADIPEGNPARARASAAAGGDPLCPFEIPLPEHAGLDADTTSGPWVLSYEGFDPALEGRREALLALGNGYFATRGAAIEAAADGIHYPGTYLAGGYNRLTTGIAGRMVEHEDLVNLPNWLPLAIGLGDGVVRWFSPSSAAELLLYRVELDLSRGLYSRIVRFRDPQGRVTRLDERRFVHMQERHLAGLEMTVTPENWSGRLSIRSALDGRVTNSGVLRYRPFNDRHLRPLEAAVPGPDTILLQAETTQSHLRIAEAARTRLYRGEQPLEPERRAVGEADHIAQEMAVAVTEAEGVTIEKIVALHTSRDRAIADPRTEALTTVSRAGRFAELADRHALAWTHLWRRGDLDFLQVENDQGNHTHRIVRLHIFQLLQTVSPHSIDADAGIPARGWTGEAYRGHVFWDEIFIFPFLNLRYPALTRALLLYRYRRLPEARWAAREAGYAGAMFPWQSGSNGREETDKLLFNPRSRNWILDNTHLQRHVNAAVAFNVWHYYQASGDAEFLYAYGAELMLDIARFWGSIAQWNPARARYEIRGVMGPDEFHDRYPDKDAPGLNNNAYTNVMAVWCLEHALRLFEILPGRRCRELCESLGLRRDELARWEDVSRRMFVPFHGDGLISQFEGYEKLEEFDWEPYRRKYGNIMRLDLILEAEGDTPNRYRLSKQADVLMLFYLFSAEALGALFSRLDYPFSGEMIPRNIDYYLQRTSHGSTLSGIVHAWVLSRSRRRGSWDVFKGALRSDIDDIQGGTTAEGIHLGAMAGTVDLLQRCYTGMELWGDELRFNPALPDELNRLSFDLRYRRNSLFVDIAETALVVASDPAAPEPVTIRVRDDVRTLKPGESVRFTLSQRS